MISVPAGAKIWVNDEYLGEAPVLYRERSRLPGRTVSIRAQFPGKKPLVRRETVRICPTPGNLILDSLLVGFAVGFCLKDEYVLDFSS